MMDLREPDLEVVAVASWNELLKSGVLEIAACERGGKRRLDGCISRQSLPLCSPSWRRILNHFDGKLASMSYLALFSKILGDLLTKIVVSGFHGEVEIIDKNIFSQTTDCIVNLASSLEADINEIFNCLEVLVHTSFLWPGSSQFGSEMGSVQHTLVGVLSLPWLKILEGRYADLRLGEKKGQLEKSSPNIKWSADICARALQLLLIFPRDVCPKWRLSVAKQSWNDEKNGGLVSGIPFLIQNLGNGATSLGNEVIKYIASQETRTDLVRNVAKVCSKYTCSLAKSVTSKLVLRQKGEENICSTEVSIVCSLCDVSRSKKVDIIHTVDQKELEPFIKLIGHQDIAVRISLVSLISSWSIHSTISSDAASLWLTCVTDSEEKVRINFAANVQHLICSKTGTLDDRDGVINAVIAGLVDLAPTMNSQSYLLDSYVQTLVSVANATLPLKSYLKVLDLLLELYFSPKTTVTAYVRALPVLQAALTAHKNHVVSWCAKTMCQKQNDPKQIISYLTLLCPTDIEPGEFINNNLHHILPPVVLYSVAEGNASSSQGSDSTLEMISTALVSIVLQTKSTILRRMRSIKLCNIHSALLCLYCKIEFLIE